MQEDQDTNITSIGETTGVIDYLTDGLMALDGIPLPSTVKKSFWKSICMLITGIADVPAAKLEAISRSIRIEGQAKDAVTVAAARAAATQFNESPELADRAVNHFAANIVKEQRNRETIVKLAADDLRTLPPVEDTGNEIDEDWLTMFSEIAQKKTNSDMQMYLSKILSGEIRKPGSFSPASINTLATLSQPVALTFQKLCNMSMQIFDVAFILTSPYPNFKVSGAKELDISYKQLVDLQDHGLLAGELSSTYEMGQFVDRLAFDYCGQKVMLRSNGGEAKPLGPASITLFSQVGLELRQIISKQPILEYTQQCQEWFGKCNISMVSLSK